MNCEIVEEGYEPRPGKMDTRRLWIAYPDYIAAYSEVSYRIAHSALVLTETDRDALLVALLITTRPAGLTHEEMLALDDLHLKGWVTISPSGQQVSWTGPVSQAVLLTLLTME